MSAAAAARHDDFLDFCAGVRSLTGIDLEQYKRGQMERRVRTFGQRRGARSLDDYLALIAADADELDTFLDRVTINVSQLWRNPEQWDLLAREILPELARHRRIRIWSAGCSYGAEPYTVAALCLDVVPDAHAEIYGSDIDARMVARAREGRFGPDDARSAPADRLGRWFDRDGDAWVAKPELKRLCRFQTGDLLRTVVPRARWDLILCRNTVIYFTEQVRDELHARLAAGLRPGGYLVVGATERVASAASLGLVAAHPFTYRKV